MSSTDSVPKPEDAGGGLVAVANTRSSLSNIRSGPGVNYRDIGDILE